MCMSATCDSWLHTVPNVGYMGGVTACIRQYSSSTRCIQLPYLCNYIPKLLLCGHVQMPTMPVIDINKLPRYGVLAPPIAREPKQAGRLIDYDRGTHTFVKNRGVLREALENKTGWLEGAPVRLWSDFAARQKHRYVPIPPDANRRTLPETKGEQQHTPGLITPWVLLWRGDQVLPQCFLGFT